MALVMGVKYWILLGMQVSGRMLAWRVSGPEFKPQGWNNNKQGMGVGQSVRMVFTSWDT